MCCGLLGTGSNRLSGRSFTGRSGNLLRGVAGACEVPVGETWCERRADDRLDGASADVEFAASVVGGPVDRLSGDFRLEDRWHRLRDGRVDACGTS